MALILPNSIENDTAADAAELQANFNYLQTYVNTEVLHRDGSVALTSPLLLPGDPTTVNQAANKGYVDGNDALKVNKAGDTMTAPLIVEETAKVGKRVAAPTQALFTHKDAATAVEAAGLSVTSDGTVQLISGIGKNITFFSTATGPVYTNRLSVAAAGITATVPITASDAPTAGGHLTNKTYVDATIATQVATALNQSEGDARYVNTAGDTMSGYLNVGAIPLASAGRDGISVRTDGAIQSLVTTGAAPNSLPNLLLGRQGTQAQATGGTFIRFERLSSGADCGSITITSTGGTSYGETSDYRVKDELGAIDNPVERFMELRPKHLAMKENGVEFDGFIAHEVAEVVPNAVTGEKDAATMQQLDTGKLIPLLVATVQQLVARVAELEAV